AWLSGYEHPVIERINTRIQEITGLDVTTAEELQVANYGVGGQYEPHFDFGRKDEPDAFKELGTGNRVATWLFYPLVYGITECNYQSSEHRQSYKCALFEANGYAKSTKI
ncbi:hypothetical protein AB205_0217840, partial [Aquarana catesbeiana]